MRKTAPTLRTALLAKGHQAVLSPCKTLEDIRDTCRRHIKNTQLMLLGCIDAEDLTDTDAFYLDMQERMWNDLLQDVNKMLKEREVEKMLKDAE